MAIDLQALKTQLFVDEGDRPKPYVDTVGKVSIGVGRNLTDVGISPDERDLMLANDIQRTLIWLDANISWWRTLDDARQGALANMAFDLRAHLLEFTNTLAAIRAHNWQMAYNGMLASEWAKEVGDRATRLAQTMLTGAPQ